MIRIHTGAYADADKQLTAFDEHGSLECAHELATDPGDVCNSGRCRVYDGEFVPSEAGGEASGSTRRFPQAVRNALQHEIAKRVTHAVVDILEVVQIEEKHRYLCVARGALEGRVQVRQQLPAIGKPCQRVVLGKML